MRKTVSTHPYLVKASLPKGHRLGSKNSEKIRNSRFKTEAEALREKDALIQLGALIVLVYNKKECIYNSTK